MCSGSKATNVFNNFLHVIGILCTIDSVGSLWGPSLNPESKIQGNFLCDNTIRYFSGFGGSPFNCTLKLINVYGPYVDRIPFWEGLGRSGVLEAPNIILGGDLNFTISMHEVWRPHPRQDSQESFFVNWIEKNKLIDLEPLETFPNLSKGEKRA
jgi:hypothetical protein